MKKSPSAKEQIVLALKQTDRVMSVPDICSKLGISDATFCTWWQNTAGMILQSLNKCGSGERQICS
ncbi:helix-turn-helix domain-containing protein [Erwinia persicina]|uniref:helix-turn-helix domain-containing protein n=1 Tax=Erwinia persicina TaxID=55211 RepID=UPI001780CAB7|nr:helix-turn-helix domain-containing protein [Erwinia persicina]MBD8216563.1 helix-turn-helix domain-containing protein [Erwinia persicina]